VVSGSILLSKREDFFRLHRDWLLPMKHKIGIRPVLLLMTEIGRGGSLPPLQRFLGHASLAMTMRYAHLSPEHLRGEMAKTERPAVVERDAGTRVGQVGQQRPEVVEFTDERRGSSVAEQLIRNQ